MERQKQAYKVMGMIALVVLFLVGANFYLSVFGPPDIWKNGTQGANLPIVSSEGNVPSSTGSSMTLKVQDTYWMSYEFGSLASSKNYGSVIVHDHEQFLVMNARTWERQGLLRLLHSVIDPEFRYAYGIYLVHPTTRQVVYQFPGSSPVISPDGRHVVFERSRANGQHEILVWTPSSGSVTTLITLQEVDPGSGLSFSYGWSAQETVRIEGDSRQMRDFVLEYAVSDKVLRKFK